MSFHDDEFLVTEDVSQLIKSAMSDITESIIKGVPTQEIIMGTRHRDVRSLQPYQRQEALTFIPHLD